MGPPVHSALITRARRIAATASAKCSTHSLRAEHITQAKLGGASDHVIADQTRVDHFTKALRAEDHAERSTTPLLAFDPVGRLDRGIVLAVHADRTDTANDAVRQVCGLVSTRLSIAEKARGFMDGHGGEHGADIVYENGRFFTVDDARPWATAVAVRDGRLVAVGTRDEIDSWIAADTNVVDLEGCFVMPGIHDAHVHPADGYKHEEAGNLLFSAELDQDGIADSLRSFAAANPDREWIRAEQYGLGAFPDGKLTKVFLDAVVPDRPALVYDEGFHGAGVNSKALEIAGLTKETPDPPLGFIDRDPETGELTGYLAETGIGLVARHITRVDKQSLRRATDRALAEMTASGITAFIDMMGYEDLLAIYRDLEAAVRLPFRVVVALGMNEFTGEVITPGEAAMLVGHLNDYSTRLIDANHFKYWADGTAISFTSLLVEPYTNDPSTRGAMTMTPGMRDTAVELMVDGLSAHFHANGDGTVREVLRLVEEARLRFPGQIRRVHIGHNLIVHPDDIPRFEALEVVAEFSPPQWFPTAATQVMRPFIGDRMDRWMPIKDCLDAGAMVAYGSDWPAGTPTVNPWRSLQGLVTRQDPSGQFPGRLGEPIDLASALRMMTLGGAFAMGHEHEHGSLEPGKYADMIVLDWDLFETPAEDISGTKVLRVVFGGESIHVAS